MPVTPVKPSRRTNLESADANFTHRLELGEIRETVMSPFITSVKELFHNNPAWIAIIQDARVLAALAALVALDSKKENDYLEVINLLNAISYAYIQHSRPNTQDDELVVFFDSPHFHYTKGDYLGINARPDWVAYVVTLKYLRDVVLRVVPLASDPPLGDDSDDDALALGKPLPQGWPRLLGVGEGKPDNNRKQDGQFLKYLGGLKRMRPDLATAHGFQYSQGIFRITSLNACGIIQSDWFDRGDVEPWLTYAVLLYQSHEERDAKINHRLPVDCHVRCDITLPRGTFCFVPAYASKHPGRMTWVAFQVGGDSQDLSSVCAKDCEGFVKVSWQNVNGEHKEIELLEHAHKDTWLPGLVRHWSGERDAAHPIVVGDSVTRVKDTLHLASVGDPLSKCSSLLQLLKVIFDLCEVHLQLLERGILHRDVSWYNVLCNPWHDPNTLKEKHVASGMRFIDWVLENDDSAQPTVLLTDLDHSALYPQLYKDDYKPRKERTGTPGFMAMELAASKIPIAYRVSPPDPEYLLDVFSSVEGLGDVYTRAFADDKGEFMANFEKVVNAERVRRRKRIPAFTNPAEFHRPAHDVESMYWVLFWSCLRACPVGATADDESETVFSSLAFNLLGHKIGKENDPRYEVLIGECRFARALHARLGERMARFFEDITVYLSIPWHLYSNIVRPDHAHIALRRLLLLQIHALHGKPEDDIQFDISQPRIIVHDAAEATNRLTEPITRDRMTSTTQATQGSISTGRKRKSPDDDDDSGSANPMPKRPRLSPEPSHKCRLAGCNTRSAGARVEKLWDKFLWFGLGRRTPRLKSTAV